jgi:hypothetical protein
MKDLKTAQKGIALTFPKVWVSIYHGFDWFPVLILNAENMARYLTKYRDMYGVYPTKKDTRLSFERPYSNEFRLTYDTQLQRLKSAPDCKSIEPSHPCYGYDDVVENLSEANQELCDLLQATQDKLHEIDPINYSDEF